MDPLHKLEIFARHEIEKMEFKRGIGNHSPLCVEALGTKMNALAWGLDDKRDH
jgi:hypothetical protein